LLENIFRFGEEKGPRALRGAREARPRSRWRHGHDAFAGRDLRARFVHVEVSGRFLYQFGITAAAAVLVSLLGLFTLTRR